MRRRRCLGLLGGVGLAFSSGCLSNIEHGCPAPDLENELEYEQRTASAVYPVGEEGVRIARDSADVDRFDSEYLESIIAEWARNTDFDQQVVLGIQVGSSGESSPLNILGVERENNETVHACSCIEKKGATDDLGPYASVLRVPFEEQPPENATLTHWEAGEKQVFD